MATRAPTKEKRRNSEKRKEKSRDAARCRRSKESEIFTDMAQLLPIPTSLSSQLDKASIMRLTIAFLQTRSLLGNSAQEMSSLWNDEERSSVTDHCWPQALSGILLALSSEGDIIYLSENVTQQLGLPQVDLIGHSIYDYCHPCDHDELREMLSLRPDAEVDRSFFLRLKSTLSVKGRSNHLKASSYKVMNCSGRIVPSSGYDKNAQYVLEEDEDSTNEDSSTQVKNPTSHFLVLIAEPIPHPSNIEMPLDGYTFLTKHSLDMKFTYVDEKINDFLGYSTGELEGLSAYQLHHAQDNDAILKSYKTMFTKGQIQTPPYRFLARFGGYAWVQTQATLVYGGRDSRPQAIVCVHTCLSEIEDEDQALCINQTTTRDSSLVQRSATTAVASLRSRSEVLEKPQNITSKLFVPKTSDMDEGFLIFDKVNGPTVLKEEPEDLTHLAPIAGDTCIALDMPTLTFPSDLYGVEELTPELFDCLPLSGFELPFINGADEMMEDSEENRLDEPNGFSEPPPLAVNQDPFIFFNTIQTTPMSNNSTDCTSSSPISSKTDQDIDDELEVVRPVQGTKSDRPPMTATASLTDDEEELNRRAPYIPMSESDDLPLFDPSELFSGMDLDCLPVLSPSKSEPTSSAIDQSLLVQLLQNDREKLAAEMLPSSCHQLSGPYHAHKRCSLTPADESNPKRMRSPTMAMASAGQHRRGSFQPSRGATCSLLELLMEKPPVLESQSASVLQNLLVSGRDLKTGHDLKTKRASISKAAASSTCFVPLPLSSLPSSVNKHVDPSSRLPMSWQAYNPTDSRSSNPMDSGGSQPRPRRTFNTLNNFPLDLDLSPGSSTLANNNDPGDFFSSFNLSGEFLATNGATK